MLTDRPFSNAVDGSVLRVFSVRRATRHAFFTSFELGKSKLSEPASILVRSFLFLSSHRIHVCT